MDQGLWQWECWCGAKPSVLNSFHPPVVPMRSLSLLSFADVLRLRRGPSGLGGP